MAGFTFDFDYRARHGMRPPPDDLPIIRDRAQDYHEADVATHADKIETYFAGGFVYNLDQEVPGWIRMGWVPDEPLEPGAFERILHEEMERAGTPTGPVH